MSPTSRNHARAAWVHVRRTADRNLDNAGGTRPEASVSDLHYQPCPFGQNNRVFGRKQGQKWQGSRPTKVRAFARPSGQWTKPFEKRGLRRFADGRQPARVAHTSRSERCVRLTNLRQSLLGLWAKRNRVAREDGGAFIARSSVGGTRLSRGRINGEGVGYQGGQVSGAGGRANLASTVTIWPKRRLRQSAKNGCFWGAIRLNMGQKMALFGQKIRVKGLIFAYWMGN